VPGSQGVTWLSGVGCLTICPILTTGLTGDSLLFTTDVASVVAVELAVELGEFARKKYATIARIIPAAIAHCGTFLPLICVGPSMSSGLFLLHSLPNRRCGRDKLLSAALE
jgi:hypothetical protein